MKRIVILIICFSVYLVGYSQAQRDMDEVSPFHEELAAIKNGKQWAFINKSGERVIDFRDDLVPSKSTRNTSYYPIFVEGKCLIKKIKDGISYYGYINTKGSTVIEPQFLNASNFVNGYAIIIKLEKREMGDNSLLGKPLTSKRLEEYAIDATGKIVKYLENSRGYLASNGKKTPKFRAKFIAPRLIAVKNKKGKWDIHKF